MNKVIRPLAATWQMLVIAFFWSFVSEWTIVLLGIIGMRLDGRLEMLITNFGELAAVGLMVWVYRKQKGRLPFARAHAGRDIGVGAALGFGMFALVWVIVWQAGGYSVELLTSAGQIGWLLIWLASFVCQSTLEEVLCRGYVMGHWLRRSQPVRGMLYNSLFFTFLHIANPGFDWRAALGIFGFGMFASLLRYRSGNLWLSAACHTLWNFAEGVVFGTAVSGLDNIALVWRSWPTAASEWLTGGVFGIERSGPSILMYALGIAVLVVILRRFGPRPQK